MSQPERNNQTMKWMGFAMIVCCAVPISTALILGGGLGAWFSRSAQPTSSNPPAGIPVSSSTSQPQSVINTFRESAKNWQINNHVHGLAVNPINPNILYIATHNGLVQRSETGQWLWMQSEKERADYMGFTADPTNPNRFYASGHPHTGGNLGFQVTDDQAKSWKQLSMPGVDFHALAVAPNNTQIFYGFPASGAEGLHVSIDGGKTWKKLRAEGLEAPPFNFVVDPANADHVFAITQIGLYQYFGQILSRF